jgi:uncharacterized protein (DUF2342 family)
LLGLELKLRQYQEGRAFCDAVVAAGGTSTLALAWSSPEALPSAAELAEPSRWIARVSTGQPALEAPPAGEPEPPAAREPSG